MIAYTISFIFLALAAFCNVLMDKPSHHMSISVFKNLNPMIWGPESWRAKYIDGIYEKGRVKWKIFGFEIIKPVQFCDSWHFFKMLMIFFVVFAIMTFPTSSVNWDWWQYGLAFCGYGVAWNGTFVLFYTYLFDLRKNKGIIKPFKRKLNKA